MGDRGVSRHLNDARFAQAMAMGLQSGLPMEEALELAAGLLSQTPAAAQRCRSCTAQLEQGEELSGAMRESGVLPPAACRLLALGVRGGTGDTVMEEIARPGWPGREMMPCPGRWPRWSRRWCW
ncbi:MAG: type II secretion system F family protein [Dysosmobacter sp.]